MLVTEIRMDVNRYVTRFGDRTISKVRVTKETVNGSEPIIEHKKIEVKKSESKLNSEEKTA